MLSAIFKTFFLSICIIANTSFAYAQTASILPPAKTQFLDNSGKPLTSGTVDFYIPSTTTRKTTWQDAAETIPNANPVVLDAGGRAIILGDGSYRQVVKDRLGNTIWDQVTSSTGSGSSSTATGDGDLVGTIKPWAGMTAPNQYAFTYGQEVSRTTYAALYTAITSSQAAFCNSASPTLSGLTDTTNFWIGMSVEISCVAAGFSTIVSKTATTVTMAANANVTTNTTAIFYPWGRGNGTTTFNLPDYRGIVPAGNNNMGGVASANLNTTYFGTTDPNSAGALGGSQSTTFAQANFPLVNFVVASGQNVSVTSTGTNVFKSNGVVITNTYTISGGAISDGVSPGTGTLASVASTGTVTSTGTASSGGSGTPFSRVQPTRTTNYIIKITPDANSATASGVTSLGAMTGSIACGAGLLCTGNIISTTGARGTSGYALTGNGLSVDASYQGFTGFNATASNTRTWQAKAQDTFSVLDYAAATGCVPDGVTDCSAAFNAAIQAAFDYASANPHLGANGTVYVPAAPLCYRVASTITMLRRVNLVGAGYASCILADNVDAITMAYVSGYGQTTIKSLSIQGANATVARKGITRNGTADVANMMLGLSIENITLRDFDTAIQALTVQNLWITNNWFQNINQCIELNGFTAVVKIQGNQCVKAAGGGVGAVSNAGIALNQYNYTISGGLISPEGVEIQQTQTHGFNIGLNVSSAVFTTISNSDISATVDGIRIDDGRGGVYINNNYIALTSATGAFGVNAVALAGSIDTQINIYSNTFISSTSVISKGIFVGTNQSNVNIVRNLFDGMAVRDVEIAAPKQVTIDNNRMRSTGTDSINLATTIGGINLVTNNETAADIVEIAGDLTNGNVREANNIVIGVRQAATWNVETNATTANRLMLGGGAGVQPSALGAGTTTTVLHGNAGGAPAFSSVVSADMNITTTSCINQFVSAISSGGIGTCSTVSASQLGGLGTGVATALGVNVGTAGSFVVNGGVLGTPSSGTVTNLTGTASININGTVGATTTNTGAFTSVGYSTTLTGTTSSANALAVGPNGTTNPAFNIDASTASSATGLNIKSAAAASGVALSVLSSGADENLIINAKGAGTITFNNVGTGDNYFRSHVSIQHSAAANLVPDAELTINNNTGASIAPPAGTLLHLVAADSTINRIVFDSYAQTSVLGAYRANGTQAAKTAVVANDNIFVFGANGWNTSAQIASTQISFRAAETFSATASGGYIAVFTTPLTTTGVVESLRFQPSGGVSIGATAIAADPGVNNLYVSGFEQTGAVAVASLPTCNAARKAARYFVTDANATFTAGIGAVVAAGGANNVPVTCDGTNWRIG